MVQSILMSANRIRSEYSGRRATGNKSSVGGNCRSKDERADGRELDKDVDGWARGILEGISNSVTNDSSSMLTVSFRDKCFLVIFDVVAGEFASFNELLAVIPSTTRVRGGESNLDSRNNTSCKDTVGSLVTKEPSHKEWRDNDKASWVDHLFEGRSS